MRTSVRICVGIVMAVALLVPRDAFALIGWIEKLSGPGPFPRAREFTLGRLACLIEDGTGELKVATILNGDSANRLACLRDDRVGDKVLRAFLSLEVSTGRSARNELYEDAARDDLQVRAFGMRPIVFARVYRGFDVGVGLGFNRFSGADLAGTPYSLWRVSVPLRLYVTPADLLPRSVLRDKRVGWLRALYYGEQLDVFPRRFEAADFGAAGSWVSERPDNVRSRFLGLDFLKLVARN